MAAKKEKKPKEKKAKKGAKSDAASENADGAAPVEGAEGAEGEAKPKKKLAGKTLVLFVILPALLVLGGGGGAAFMLLKGGGPPAAHATEDAGHGKEKKKKKDKEKGGHGSEKGGEGDGHGVVVSEGEGVMFMSLPDILVNISAADGRPAYLKLKLTLEAADEETVEALEPQLPRITDQFNAFLRELRTDDLSGSAGAYRLRLELLRRVNLVIAPKRINAVLIEEMLVQ
ncbi:MAG: flagellar basal body-associated FliL family protein [Hyphomonadaceae bacterium]|nr:flagellar basal body-associated FliL family protein [Hyphomonadaceae bacterium]